MTSKHDFKAALDNMPDKGIRGIAFWQWVINYRKAIQTALRLADRLQGENIKMQERTLVDNSHGGGKFIWQDIDLIKECE